MPSTVVKSPSERGAATAKKTPAKTPLDPKENAVVFSVSWRKWTLDQDHTQAEHRPISKANRCNSPDTAGDCGIQANPRHKALAFSRPFCFLFCFVLFFFQENLGILEFHGAIHTERQSTLSNGQAVELLLVCQEAGGGVA